MREIDPALTIHDFRMTDGPQYINLIFDVVAPRSCALDDEALKTAIARRLRAEDEQYCAVIQVDHSYVE